MNAAAIVAIRSIGEQLIELATALGTEEKKVTSPDDGGFYSQAARDRRQYPWLRMLADAGEPLPWMGPGSVTEKALEAGYTARGLGGLFQQGGLLMWAQGGKVAITHNGKLRLAEIEARRKAKGDDA